MDTMQMSDHRALQYTAIHTQTSLQGPIIVVASVTYDRDGNVFDWAAYIGLGSGAGPDSILGVAEMGEKLHKPWAAGFFPHLNIDLYRE